MIRSRSIVCCALTNSRNSFGVKYRLKCSLRISIATLLRISLVTLYCRCNIAADLSISNCGLIWATLGGGGGGELRLTLSCPVRVDSGNTINVINNNFFISFSFKLVIVVKWYTIINIFFKYVIRVLYTIRRRICVNIKVAHKGFDIYSIELFLEIKFL